MGRSLTALAVDSRGVAQRDEKKGSRQEGSPCCGKKWFNGPAPG
jgi:hypothetical protein